jgi:hypothetical protein
MSPLRIVIEFGDSLDPPQRFFLVLSIEPGDLLGNPAANGGRSGIGYNKA